MASPLAAHWTLDRETTFLNHGSFGACPRAVLARQAALREQLERDPVRFFERDFEPLLDAAREALASLVGADVEGLAFVNNATTAASSVLRSLELSAGDELLTTSHAYPAVRNAMDFVARRASARVVAAPVPFPIDSPGEVVAAIAGAVTPRTRLAVIDHVTSATGLVLPIAEIVSALGERGVDTLVDGAHGPGMVDLDVDRIGAAYYTGNCHKWLCAPKGAAFLHARADRRAEIHPAVISHGIAAPRGDRSRFWLEFDWTGTDDPTAALCVPAAIETIAALVPGGWPEVRERNRALALAGRDIVCEALGVEPPAPASMIGSMAALLLEAGGDLHDRLFDAHRVQVPVQTLPGVPGQILRISAQLYNDASDYRTLARALAFELGRYMLAT